MKFIAEQHSEERTDDVISYNKVYPSVKLNGGGLGVMMVLDLMVGVWGSRWGLELMV